MHSQMSQKKVKATSKIELHTVQIYVQLVWFSPSILLEMRTFPAGNYWCISSISGLHLRILRLYFNATHRLQ